MQQFHLHLISDSTGETAGSVARAAIAQFDAAEPVQHSWPLVRTAAQLAKVIETLEEQPGVVLYTLVSPELEEQLLVGCRRMGMPCVNVLGSVMSTLSAYLGVASGHKPGRESDDERIYFNAVGLAYIDVAIGLAMYRRALSSGVGRELDLQQSMIFEHTDIISQVRL